MNQDKNQTFTCDCCGNEKVGSSVDFDLPQARLKVCFSCVSTALKEVCPDSLGELSENIKYDYIVGAIKYDNLVTTQLFDVIMEMRQINQEMRSVGKVTRVLRTEKEIRKEKREKKKVVLKKSTENWKAVDVYRNLNDHVVGQDSAKKALSIMIERRSMALKNKAVKKTNVLLVGPTGCGKTELMRTIEKTVGVPMVKVDCSQLTPAGYKGRNVGEYLKLLLTECNGNVALAQKSIVYLDEIDKLVSSNREFTTHVQSELLRMIEGDDFYIDLGHGNNEKINTSNITFVASGAFTFLRKGKSEKITSIGFGSTPVKETEEDMEITRNDLASAGIFTELIGRFQVVENLTPMSKDMLKSIFTELKNNIRDEYKIVLSESGIDIDLESEEVVNEIVEEAFEMSLGARGLRIILENMIRDSYFMDDSKLPETNKKLELVG